MKRGKYIVATVLGRGQEDKLEFNHYRQNLILGCPFLYFIMMNSLNFCF